MEAVSKANPSVGRAEYVQFTDLSTEEEKQNGTYKIQIKLLKQSDDLMIRPKCLLIPNIISVSLNDSASYEQDTPIKITFNKPVNLSDFSDVNGNLKNIAIHCGDEDLLDSTNGKVPYYSKAYFIDGDKTLVIPITKGVYLIKNEGQTKVINVKLNLAGIKDAVEGENVEFNKSNYSFSYKINSQKDSVPPHFKILQIARNKEDAEKGTNLITLDEFIHYAAKVNYNENSNIVAQNIQNHHVNKVWIYFETEDSESGVAGIEIKEQLIRTTSGDVTEGIIYSRETPEPKNKNFFENPEEKKDYSDCIEYNFNDIEDGVTNLEIRLFDYAGNSVSNTIDLVKDTKCEDTVSARRV